MKNDLESERSEYHKFWQDVADYAAPRLLRFDTSNTEKGYRQHTKIVNSTATLDLEILVAGMQASITPSWERWAELGDIDDSDGAPREETLWYQSVTEICHEILLASNFYKKTPAFYEDISCFGTAAIYAEEDLDRVINFHSLTMGTFYVAQDHRGRVNTLFRDFTMTVQQIVDKFGKKDGARVVEGSVPGYIKTAYENGRLQERTSVTHAVLPNPDYIEGHKNPVYRKYASVYYVNGEGTLGLSSETLLAGQNKADEKEVILRRSGMEEFGTLVGRWRTVGEDVYGTRHPFDLCIDDVKQLQYFDRKTMRAADQGVDPTMLVDEKIRNKAPLFVPGEQIFTALRGNAPGAKRAVDVNYNIEHSKMVTDTVAMRIGRAMKKDLFMAVLDTVRSGATATEVDAKTREKMMILGPFNDIISTDVLDPLMSMVFNYANRQGRIPEAPESIQGRPIKIRYVSAMAKAQAMIGAQPIERYLSFIGNYANLDPRVLRKVNAERAADEYARVMGVPAKIMSSQEEIDEMIAREQEQMEAQQEQEAAMNQAQTMKDLGQAKVESDNALGQLAEATGG